VVSLLVCISQAVVLEACVAALTGDVLCKFVVLEQPPSTSKQQQQQQQQQPSFSQHLLVHGAIVPFWIAAPCFAIQWLDLRNLVFKFAVAVITPILTLLRMTEGTKTPTKWRMFFCSMLLVSFCCSVARSGTEWSLLSTPSLSLCVLASSFAWIHAQACH
jgi:hypothetical protein